MGIVPPFSHNRLSLKVTPWFIDTVPLSALLTINLALAEWCSRAGFKRNCFQCFGVGDPFTANCTLEHILVYWSCILIQKVALIASLTFCPSLAGTSRQPDYNLPGGVSNTLPCIHCIESAQFVPNCPCFTPTVCPVNVPLVWTMYERGSPLFSWKFWWIMYK